MGTKRTINIPLTLDQSNVSGNPPVTVVVTRCVKTGREQEYEDFVQGIINAASQFPGYLGTSAFRPKLPQDKEYRLVFRFDHLSSLRNWEESSERLQWLIKSEPLADEPPVTKVLSGLDTWFDCLGQHVVKSPPRYKMAVLVWLAIFPLISLLLFFLGPWINDYPLLLKTGVLTCIAVPIMVYLLIPRLTQWFAGWLYPKEKTE